jgi:hypothetical protein
MRRGGAGERGRELGQIVAAPPVGAPEPPLTAGERTGTNKRAMAHPGTAHGIR